MSGVQKYIFDSSLRYTGTNNSPKFTIPNVGITEANWFYVNRINIPHTFYNITSLNNQWHWTDNNSADIVSTIPVGNYTIDEILTELGAQMSADTTDGATYSCSRSARTNKVSITNTSGATFAVRYVFSSHNLHKLLGFFEAETAEGQFYGDSNRIQALPAAVTQTANDTYYAGVRHIFVKSNIGLQVNNYRSGTIGSIYKSQWSIEQGRQDILFHLPVESSYGGVETYELQGPPVKLYLNNNTLSDITFELLYDEDYLPLDLNGRPWSIELVFGMK